MQEIGEGMEMGDDANMHAEGASNDSQAAAPEAKVWISMRAFAVTRTDIEMTDSSSSILCAIAGSEIALLASMPLLWADSFSCGKV